MTSHVIWICIKCGEAHLLWSHNTNMPVDDKCTRCGWIRPMNIKQQELLDDRWGKYKI